MPSTQEEMDRIRARVTGSQYGREKENAESAFGRTAHQVQVLQRFFTSVARVAVWIWWNFGNPFLNRVTMPVVMFVLGWYIRIWNRYVFPRDKYGVEHFSYARGAKMLVGTVFGAWLGWGTLWLCLDTVLFYLPPTSQHNETVYLFGSTDNSFRDDNWSVTGCEVQAGTEGFSCDDEHTLYYRIESTWFSNVYTMLVHHNIFLPEVVGAPVAPGWNECRVNSMGIRLKLLVRNLQWYVNLLDTSCKPILINQLTTPEG